MRSDPLTCLTPSWCCRLIAKWQTTPSIWKLLLDHLHCWLSQLIHRWYQILARMDFFLRSSTSVMLKLYLIMVGTGTIPTTSLSGPNLSVSINLYAIALPPLNSCTTWAKLNVFWFSVDAIIKTFMRDILLSAYICFPICK